MTLGNAAQQRLKEIVEKIERLEAEKAAAMEEIRGVYKEAKSTGFDVKVLRKLISRRRKRRAEVDEEDSVLEIYEGAFS